MWNCSTLFGSSGMGGFHPWGGMFHIFFWGALILGIIWAVKRITSQGNSSSTPGPNGAIAILDNRLARGEISPEEYRETKQILSNG